jgi:hypothetical protein
MQDVIVILLLVSAVSYLGYKLYKKLTKKNSCDDGSCGCK